MPNNNMENKVQFGLKKLAYAIITEAADGTLSFGTPVMVPGAVSISQDAENGETVFYADDIKYYVSNSNNGYSGEIELARVPDQMRQDIYGVTVGTDGVMIESVNDEVKDVALLFEFSGDKNSNRGLLYRCTLGRPSENHSTLEDTKDPQTATIPYTAVPLPDGKIKATTTKSTSEEVKNAWYTSVFGIKST